MKKLLIFILLASTWACVQTSPPAVITTQEKMVQDCRYLDTISEISDPGRFLPEYRENDAEIKVLQRADQLGGTHVVWLYHYRIGSAALVYSCDNEKAIKE
jgi:hypothetical protein